MKKILFLCLFIIQQSHAQEKKINRFFIPSDTLNNKRLAGVCIAQGSIWAGSLVALNQAWYASYPRSSFHFFDDSGEWQQVDKVGHSFSAYWGANLSAQMFRWAGVGRKRAALYGAGMGIAYESVIEILDGFSSEWGFSAADMASNASGSVFFAVQELAWENQRIEFKFSSHRINYADPELRIKADNLYGASLAERILKDYNGQTYWLSANLRSFAPGSRIPRWLNAAVGYGATGMFGGYANHWIDKNNIYHDRRDVARIRQFYLSPDIDLSKIEYRGKKLRLLKLLNGIKLKFPLPAVEINTGGGLRLHPLFF